MIIVINKLMNSFVNNTYSGWISPYTTLQDDDGVLTPISCNQDSSLGGDFDYFYHHILRLEERSIRRSVSKLQLCGNSIIFSLLIIVYCEHIIYCVLLSIGIAGKDSEAMFQERF